MTRKAIVVLSVVVGVVVAGVVALVIANREPFTVSDYTAMCEEPRPFEEAAAVSVDGPHPIYIADYGVEPVPEEKAVWSPEDPGAVQLVACVVETGKGAFVKRCQYTRNGGGPITYTIDLYRGKYRLDVYEARTGTPVATKEVEGEQFVGNMDDPKEPCQGFLTVYDEDNPQSENLGRPSAKTLRAALEEHVR